MVGTRALSVPTALAISAVVAAGCADARSHVAAAPYKQAAAEKCLRAEKVQTIPVKRAGLDYRVRAKFPGVVATIGIVFGGGKTPPGFGPPIDGGTLIFEKTAALAQRDQSGLYTIIHQPWLSPLDPAAPARFIRSLQSTKGNVVILWDYPRRKPAVSMRLVEKCLIAQ